MDIIKQILGRLHPLVVHLPIGFIILGILLQWYDRKKHTFRKAITLTFFWGGISAVFACITGYLQYLSEGYKFDSIKFHLWLGVITTIFCFLVYIRLKTPQQINFFKRIPRIAFALILFLLISFTGHLGGNITHGEGFLIEPLPDSIKSALGFETFEEKTISLNEKNWKDAMLYEDVINPILYNKCVSCHNTKKFKGELILQTQEGILNGGEKGKIIVLNNSQESSLYARLILPEDDEDHMPPKEKIQLTKEEIKLIEVWISYGNSFDESIQELSLQKELFLSFFPQKTNYNYPDVQISAVAQDTINSIRKNGIHVENIARTTNFLRVSCINKPDFTDEDFDLLMPIIGQIAVLDFGGTLVTDAVFEKLVQLPNLTILKLDNTAVTGKNMQLLADTKNLKSINLTSSKFEVLYLEVFTKFSKLKTVYLHKTQAIEIGVKTLNNGLITLVYGNYELPVIASDSIIY